MLFGSDGRRDTEKNQRFVREDWKNVIKQDKRYAVGDLANEVERIIKVKRKNLEVKRKIEVKI